MYFNILSLSGHFLANCMFIFDKTEVQMVILRCLTGLNLDWFKSYCLRCSLSLCANLANLQKLETDNWPFYNQIWSFFANSMFIFHKTEVQTDILRCCTSLNLDWTKSYDTKRKNAKNTNGYLCSKLQKNQYANICILCHNFGTNQNLDPSSTSK
jgi:hypothetical protein